MVSTLDEIGKINSEIVDARRQFRWHWKALDFPVELSNRIIRFAVHSNLTTTVLVVYLANHGTWVNSRAPG